MDKQKQIAAATVAVLNYMEGDKKGSLPVETAAVHPSVSERFYISQWKLFGRLAGVNTRYQMQRRVFRKRS